MKGEVKNRENPALTVELGVPDPGQPAGPSQQEGAGVAGKAYGIDRAILPARLLPGTEPGQVLELRPESAGSWREARQESRRVGEPGSRGDDQAAEAP